MSRQILFVGLSEDRIDGNHVIEAMYELTKSNRLNFKRFFSEVRSSHFDFIITTTDDLKKVPSFQPAECSYHQTYIRHDVVQKLNCRAGIPSGCDQAVCIGCDNPPMIDYAVCEACAHEIGGVRH